MATRLDPQLILELVAYFHARDDLYDMRVVTTADDGCQRDVVSAMDAVIEAADSLVAYFAPDSQTQHAILGNHPSQSREYDDPAAGHRAYTVKPGQGKVTGSITAADAATITVQWDLPDHSTDVIDRTRIRDLLDQGWAIATA